MHLKYDVVSKTTISINNFKYITTIKHRNYQLEVGNQLKLCLDKEEHIQNVIENISKEIKNGFHY